jgi:hypothetical protein
MRKSWALVLATAALAAVSAAVYVIGQPVIYRSSASVLIEPRGRDYRSEQQYLKSQAKTQWVAAFGCSLFGRIRESREDLENQLFGHLPDARSSSLARAAGQS